MQPQPQYAQNQPNNGQPQEATDAVEAGGPLLIYTGDFTLGVYAVSETQERIIEAIRQLGGHVSQRNDAMLVVRVPAARFEAAIESIEQAGDVLGRNVQATDVSEEFRDLEIRIRNAEAMRDRLEQLLARANDVTAALSIERELQRLTEYIETMKGRQRFLADRISLSTITIRFQALGTEGAGTPDGFSLPFPWLDEIGLSNLMRLQ
jgi:L-fucose isomerase-like protein